MSDGFGLGERVQHVTTGMIGVVRLIGTDNGLHGSVDAASFVPVSWPWPTPDRWERPEDLRTVEGG